MIYYAHFYSHLKYGISVWGHMITNTQLAKLQKIQDDCLRLINNCNLTNPTTYKNLCILQVNKINFNLESSKMIYKSLKGDLPSILSEAINTDSNHQSLNKKHNYST